MGVGVDGYGKETGTVGARAHRPPDPLAPLEEWQSYRAGLDVLEAGLRVSHPDLDWLDGMRAFKAQADARIARHRAAERKPC